MSGQSGTTELKVSRELGLLAPSFRHAVELAVQEARGLIRSNGMEAVWKAVGAA